jgi:hypothetical protein
MEVQVYMRRMLRALTLSTLVVSVYGQSPCHVSPGGHTVIIPLQSQPNSFEPECQPARIRVNDRAPASLFLTGISPVEICLPASKAPTVTTVVNPLESIINTVSALKSFDFEAATPELVDNVANMQFLFGQPAANPPPAPPRSASQALSLFRQLASTLNDTAKPVFDKQTHWQGLYLTDVDVIARYLAADYRRGNYLKFHPDDDDLLATVRSHVTLPPLPAHAATLQHPELATPPTEVDYAALQALVDQMKTLQTGLVTTCTQALTTTCDSSALRLTAEVVDRASALLTAAGDNLKTLQANQTTVATNFIVLHKIYADYQTRLNTNVIGRLNGMLAQNIVLGPDYGETDSGALSCTTDTSPAQATTDAISYSILFQNVPALTVSAGLLTTFLEKREIGTTTKLNSDGTTYSTNFAVTDSARASVFPMTFVNYRTQPPLLKTWWGQRESELVITNSVSAGIGINPNTGTNQVEFFAGDAIGFGRALFHVGAHFGRTESIGGGYQLNTMVPAGFTGAPPIDWAYHVGFSIGLSVRIAPF